ncbi:MAG: pentapeptide repeat-containing protein [Coleofasciculus sp.]
MEMWLLHLAALEEHERWVRRGRQGSGCLVLENEDLKNAVLPGFNLVAARFKGCDFSQANIRGGNLTSIQLINCIWDNAMLEMATLDQAVIENCQFVGAYLNVGHFIEAQIRGGDWSKIDLHRSTWTNAQIRDVCFQNARFQGAKLHNTRLINCDLKGANIAAMTPDNAVFERCDFRHCDLNYLKLKNTLFNKCGFYGCTGTPTLEGECQVIEPDLSKNFDGSKIVDTEKLFQLWGLG